MEFEREKTQEEQRSGRDRRRRRVRVRVRRERSEEAPEPLVEPFDRESLRRQVVTRLQTLDTDSTLAWAALLTASGSISIAPWFLGGMIPHAKLFLLLGAIVSAVLMLIRFAVLRELPVRLPRQTQVLLALVLLVGYQLLPLWDHLATYMSHAVNAEEASRIPAVVQAVESGERFPSTTMPSETRQAFAQLLAITLLSLVLVESVSTSARAATAASLLAISGLVMSVMALGQRMDSTAVLFRNDLKISDTPPFGCFVNPNNAAGWLLVCLAAALFVTGAFLGRTVEPGGNTLRARTAGERISLWLVTLMRFMGGLKPLQVGAVLASATLLAAVAGTLSRAGIASGLVLIVVFFFCRTEVQGRGLSLPGLIIVAGMSSLLLLFLELDTAVYSELATLKDPVSATTIRFLHWWDMLPAVLDFPFFGSGAGAYRYSNLPYAGHFTMQWFGHADNQFLEILVESGLVGLALLGLGVWFTLQTSMQLLWAEDDNAYQVRRYLGDRVSGPILALILALSMQNFFDFSFSIPAVIASAVMLVAIQERIREQAFSDELVFAGKRPVRAGVIGKLCRFFPLLVWLIVLSSGVLQVPATWRSVKVYSVWAEARRLTSTPRPSTADFRDRGDEILAGLEEALEVYPEGEMLRRTHAIFLQAMATYSIVQESMSASPPPDADRLILDQRERERYSDYSIRPLCVRFLSPEDADFSGAIRGVFQRSVERYQWPAAYAAELRKNPFARGLAADLFTALQFQPATEHEDGVFANLLFNEPAASQHLSYVGHLRVLSGQVEHGLSLWDLALQYSEEFRAEIIAAASREFGANYAMQRYLPESFEYTSQAALRSAPGPVRDELLNIAEQKWAAGSFEISRNDIQLRARTLIMQERESEGFSILRDALDEAPGDVPHRVLLAELLEVRGYNDSAYREWERIREFDPGYPRISEHLDRLVRLPVRTLSRDAGLNLRGRQ